MILYGLAFKIKKFPHPILAEMFFRNLIGELLHSKDWYNQRLRRLNFWYPYKDENGMWGLVYEIGEFKTLKILNERETKYNKVLSIATELALHLETDYEVDYDYDKIEVFKVIKDRHDKYPIVYGENEDINKDYKYRPVVQDKLPSMY